MRKADLITGFVLLALSGFVIWSATQMPASATFGPGPGFLPLWVGVILAFLALLLLATAWRRKATGKDALSPFPGKQALLTITGVLGGLGVYILLIEALGFLADTFLFVAFLMKVVERERWPMTLVVSACTTAGLFLVFQVLLGITLPSNSLGF
ncbi:MAG: tripartite tricarboxylate transporter TctB family protein [Deltaproteobacteria bacterium]|nr:tripartite tricarboxylate transporter TctB family protein [Deltaproteobacteria bacterium]